MQRISFMKYAGLVLVIPVLAWAAFAQQAKRVDTNALRNAKKNGDEWLTYGRDYAETHYSPLKQIDTSNVGRLGLAWSWETGSPAGGRVEGTPLFSNGVLYGSLAWDVLFAVDARTGKMKWHWEPEISQEHISQICCGPVNRGVALYNGKVYAGLLDGRLVALDQETGKIVWQVQTTDDPGTIITGAVRIVKGKAIVGNSGAEQAVRGYFTAYDAETGKLAWRFYTVPGDPSKPFEHPDLAAAAKTWTGEWWKMGGGGTTWDAMAYDPDADILYVGTGNGGPWTHIYRSPGGGDNLYLASVVAVKPDTGKLVWYFQETPGDDWDFTSVQPMILADITIGGRQRKVLMHAPKSGFFYVLDRITGEFISGEKYAKRVTWAKGLDAKGRPIEAKGARAAIDAPATISPGPGGAHNWQPMSFSPLTGLVYIPGQESSYTYRVEPNFTYNKGFRNMGVVSNLGPRLPDGTTTPTAAPAGPPPREPEGAELQPKATGGFLVAWDPKTEKERWRITGAGGTNGGGGTLATAGNLVFHGPIAYNAETGEKLWSADLGGNNVTPVTYMLDGKQYVTLFARNYPENRLFTFVLDGKAPIPPMKLAAPAPQR
ncbi:MAG TPA: PQQ-dependent dehydrogenase, methanol/ethanol family [Terriglobia bacterium]|jgi:quinohemoprotein ethanol dehydrogenase